ncbi:MAG: ferredoxin [Cyanobacteria bacterium P01_H01_bin.74]
MFVSIVDGCIACGACESICPDVFTVYDEAEVNAENVLGNENNCREAAKVCPVSVIKIEQ